jgi:hypothetical protein
MRPLSDLMLDSPVLDWYGYEENFVKHDNYTEMYLRIIQGAD